MKEKVHRIGVISDTHGLLRPEVVRMLKTCKVILHGGDVDRQEILDELRKIAKVYVVEGNNDREWVEQLPKTLSFELFGLRIFMIHDRKEITDPEVLKHHDLIVFGHSHMYERRYEGADGSMDGNTACSVEVEPGRREAGCLWLNPGSCGPRRFRLPITMAVIERVEGKDGADGREGDGEDGWEAGFRVERIDLDHLTGI